MLVRTNPSKAVPALLNRLTETIEAHHAEAPSSSADDDIEKIKSDIDSLKKRFQEFVKWEKELLDQFVELNCCNQKIKASDYTSVLVELKRTSELLPNHVSGNDDTNPNQTSAIHTWENQNDFKPLEEETMLNLDNHEIVINLRVSYDLLDPVELRICLLLLAIFPEDVVLKKRLLIYWWIGEGLVREETEGEEIFGKLLELGLIMPHRIDKRPKSTVNKCKIHPWIRYMLLSVAKEEKHMHFDEKGVPRFDPNGPHSVYLIAAHTDLASELGSAETKTVRSIFNVSQRDFRFHRQWLAKLKRLGVLQLGRWQVSPTYHIKVRGESFLTGLKSQKHLKYLSLRGISRITSLPECIRELVSLLILDLKACHNLKTLPDAVSSLKRLTHLDVSECYLLESMPNGLHNLTSLRVLKGFIIGNSRDDHFRVEHLQKLDNLERLSIHIGNGADILQNEFENLKGLTQLRCLKISWGVLRTDLEISFPPALEKLDLEGFPHEHMPQWLQPSKLSRLEKLYIKGGNLKKLEGRWNNVKILILKYTNKLETQEEEILHRFPSLIYVKKVNWEEGDETSETMGKESIDFEWTSLE